MGDDLEQLSHANTERRRRSEHGVERASGHCLLEILDEYVGADLLAAEVAVHEALVFALGDDPLDERVAGRLDEGQVLCVRSPLDPLAGGVVVHLLRKQTDQASDRPVVLRHRQVER